MPLPLQIAVGSHAQLQTKSKLNRLDLSLNMGSISHGAESCAGAQTAFAMGGVQVRGDVSAWTDTPQEKLLRLQRGYEASALQAPAPTGMTRSNRLQLSVFCTRSTNRPRSRLV